MINPFDQVEFTLFIVALKSGKNEFVSVIVMSQLMDGTLSHWLLTFMNDFELDIIYEMIKSLIKTMCANNLVHGDLHWGNVSIAFSPTKQGKFKYNYMGVWLAPVLLDFGYSIAGSGILVRCS